MTGITRNEAELLGTLLTVTRMFALPAASEAGVLVINAAGPQAPLVGKMVGLDLPVDPRKRHIFVTDSFTEVRHPMPLVTDITSGFYCRSEQGAVLILENSSGAVRAMVGALRSGEFNYLVG